MNNINKKLVSSQVEDELAHFIMKDCRVGDRLPNEFQLAQKFNTSRSTIREVVKSLASQGILEVRQGSGTYVTALKRVDDDPLHLSRHKDKYRLALELFDVRLMLEPGIAAKAAEKAGPEEIKELHRLREEVETLIKEGKDHIPKDIEFHSCIARCSGNFVVQTLLPIIQTAVSTFGYLTERTLRDETINTHRMIANAIARHDSVGASCAMTSHLAANYSAIMDAITLRDRDKNDLSKKSSDDFFSE